MVENNPLSFQKNENLDLQVLIYRYNKEVKRAIQNAVTTAFLIAIPCAFSSYNCICHLLEDRWPFLCMCALAFSGTVCYRIAKGILIRRVRKRWGNPQKSSSAEWERDAAKQFDDALASWMTFETDWPPIQVTIFKTIIAISVILVVVSVLAGADFDDPDHPLRFLQVLAAFAFLHLHYGDDA